MRKTVLAVCLGLAIGGTMRLYGPVVGPSWFNRVWPKEVGNLGPTTLSFEGEGLQLLNNISLWHTETGAEIPGGIRSVVEEGRRMQATFDLEGAEPGVYDVGAEFVDPETQEPGIAYLFESLTVKEGGRSELWVEISGLTRVRINAVTDYSIYYGNTGDQEINSAVLYLAIPKALDYELLFDPRPYQDFWVPSLEADLAGLLTREVETDFEGTDYVFIPLVLRRVSAFSFTPLRVRVHWGSEPVDLLLRAFWTGSPSVSYRPLWDPE